MFETDEYPIEKNVPMTWDGAASLKYPFRKMVVGDSFFVPGGNISKLRDLSYAANCSRDDGGPCVFRNKTVNEDGVRGVRVWRVL
jgi:hypothetical protein